MLPDFVDESPVFFPVFWSGAIDAAKAVQVRIAPDLVRPHYAFRHARRSAGIEEHQIVG